MHNMNTKKPVSYIEVPKHTRHIVTWSSEVQNLINDILREQIWNHGTDNWAIIASKFKDKTTRQCRRRWYTYLNSDFQTRGWSPEEDMFLCEAQKIFGNRWTEIAKVVSGRTDNAVKNRFSTLCEKRAKAEALAKENNPFYLNLNNKRVIFQDVSIVDGLSENGGPLRKLR
ncbi:putative transcription factor MYB-HB-like family [Heracleum sosnowskyi]|uniref:Transcription factor MYB-HB-like family n=1 Tax=Heracleum sosnowskyi TaxID=360622 RepID=A0AAD8ID62_9APIA|nr:putative transcription factor MYB-HB-like family [Heracleum sosnowskyi]